MVTSSQVDLLVMGAELIVMISNVVLTEVTVLQHLLFHLLSEFYLLHYLI
jgi:hypothetical protein